MIRPVAPADVDEVVAMVHELAVYERQQGMPGAGHQVGYLACRRVHAAVGLAHPAGPAPRPAASVALPLAIRPRFRE